MAIARYTLAVDRRYHGNARDGEQTADFIPCVAFGKAGEHAEKYYRKGIKIAVSGRIQTGSYTNRDGVKVYTTDVIVEEQEFAESKGSGQNGAQSGQQGGYGQNSGRLTEQRLRRRKWSLRRHTEWLLQPGNAGRVHEYS